MTYPDMTEEMTVLDRFTEGMIITPRKVVTTEKINEIQAFTQKIYADAAIKRYACEVVDATRHPDTYGIEEARYVALGASPRATIFLILGGKAHALLNGRGYVIPEDVRAVAHDVLRHRILRTLRRGGRWNYHRPDYRSDPGCCQGTVIIMVHAVPGRLVKKFYYAGDIPWMIVPN